MPAFKRPPADKNLCSTSSDNGGRILPDNVIGIDSFLAVIDDCCGLAAALHTLIYYLYSFFATPLYLRSIMCVCSYVITVRKFMVECHQAKLVLRN